jgi:ABC-type antimicrobial peptide transport system permease subunit
MRGARLPLSVTCWSADGVSASNPITLVVVPLILIGVGVCAELVPARRAVAVDPMQALRRQ